MARGVVIGALLLGSPLWADSVRVASWNLATDGSAAPNGIDQVKAVAAAVKKIDPDILLLQHVRDWKTCSALVQALKPAEYHVVICSSFRSGPSNTLAEGQAAILAREQAYFSWSEPWRSKTAESPPGGFAFAALRFGPYKIGVFSVQLDDDLLTDPDVATNFQARRACVRRLVDQTSTIKNWTTNRVQFFAVGGALKSLSFDLTEQMQALRPLREAGFEDAWLDAPANQKSTLKAGSGRRSGPTDYIFANPVGSAGPARLWRLAGAARFPFSSDLELAADKVAVTGAARREAAALKAMVRSNQLFQARAQSNLVQNPPSPGLVEIKPAAPSGTAVKTAPPSAMATNVEPAPSKAPAKAGPVAVPGGFGEPALPTTGTPRASKSEASGVRGWLPWTAALALAITGLGWLIAKGRRVRHFRAPKLIPDTLVEGPRPDPSAYLVVTPRSVTSSATELLPEAKPMFHVENAAASVTHSESSLSRGVQPKPASEGIALQSAERFELLQWLKQKFVQRLMSDRAGMMQTNQEATGAVLDVDQRLARVEQQVQEQNRVYQRRIEELTVELTAAKEGNRELIRARISQLKAEMEASRGRMWQGDK